MYYLYTMSKKEITIRNLFEKKYMEELFNPECDSNICNTIIITTQNKRKGEVIEHVHHSNMSIAILINFLQNNVYFSLPNDKLCGIKILIKPNIHYQKIDFDFENIQVYQVNISRVVQWTLQCCVTQSPNIRTNISIELCNSIESVKYDLIKQMLTKCFNTRIVITDTKLLKALDEPIEKCLNNTLIVRRNCDMMNYIELSKLHNSISTIMTHNTYLFHILYKHFSNVTHFISFNGINYQNIHHILKHFSTIYHLTVHWSNHHVHHTIKYFHVHKIMYNDFINILSNNTSIEFFKIHEIHNYHSILLQTSTSKINDNFISLHIINSNLCNEDIEFIINNSNIIDLKINRLRTFYNYIYANFLLEKYPTNLTLALSLRYFVPYESNAQRLIKKSKTLQYILDQNTLFMKRYTFE